MGQKAIIAPIQRRRGSLGEEWAVSASCSLWTARRKEHLPLALIFGPPPPPRFPSGRYTQTNPLRREHGLLLLTGSLPEPLRTHLTRAWRQPARYESQQTRQAMQRAGRAYFSSHSLSNPWRTIQRKKSR